MMSDTGPKISDAQSEKEFRKKNLWHSFLTAAYGALGMAAYMGSLATLANGIVGIASGTATAAAVFAPLPLLAIGGLALLGTVSTYLSQYEATEVRVLQDEHLAQQNAKSLVPNLGLEQATIPEYEQNRRADGRRWQDALRANNDTTRQLH